MPPQHAISIISILPLLLPISTVTSLGYLKLPRSRNLVAYEDTVWWPRTETDPEPETTPQGLDRGGTLAQCGIVETLRNYDKPKNIFGDPMPINVQAVYEQEQEITIEVSLISSNGGHFQFSLCPIEWGEVPTQECFDAHPLEFVKDNYYGAYEDPNYPERIYVPDGKVTGRVSDTSGFPGDKQEFSYQMNLPCGLTGDLVLLQWYFVTAQDCYHEGYLDYKFPPEWGDVFEEKINECPSPLPPSGDGLPLQYWNCAEVEILKTGETARCAPTDPPSFAPTKAVTERPTNEPTTKPTPAPTKAATEEPTGSPIESRPIATCGEICLVPIEPNECSASFTDPSLTPRCLDQDGKTVFIGDVCTGSGECNTSPDLNNCDEYDVYKRVASCAKPDEASTPEDVPISIPVLENDVDGVGDGLEIVDVTQPENGSVEIVGDEIVYTPDPGYNGPDNFEYSVIDGNGFLSDAPVTIDVIPVNDGPVANDDTATTLANTNVNIPVLANDSDPEGEPLTIESIVTQPANGVAGIRPDGTIIYKPDPDFVGEDSFTYKVCDTANQCDEATVTVQVQPPPNDPPVAEDDFVTISEGMNPGPQIPVLANDNDPDGDPLKVTEVGTPENGVATISDDEEGIVYTPDEGYTGVDSFEYTTCDPGGLCDTAVVTVTVDPNNNDPIVFDDREDTPEGEPLVIDVLENDLPDVGLEVTDVTDPANGKCEITADGQVQYTPNAGFVGQDECTYTACVEGTTDCDDGTIIVDVLEKPKQPPLAVDDPVTTDEDMPVTLDPIENDQSPSGSPLNIDGVTDGQNGSCVINEDNTVTYTPNPGFDGIDICLYTVCDENELCDEGAIVVSVEDTNMPPNAEDDTVSTPYNTPVTVPVLDNDVDPNDDPLTVTDVTQGLHGKCSITDNNEILYEPDPGYVGPDLCPYVVCDDSNECDTANVFVEVQPGPPTAVDDMAETPPETPVLVDVTENDPHPQNLPLEVTDISNPPANGECVVVDGKVQYSPNPEFIGTDSCDYVVCVEGTAECDEGTLTVDVVPPKPVPEDDMAQTPPETPVLVDVILNDSHPDDLPLEVTDIANPPANGECVVVDGKVEYSPNPEFIGTDSCDYVVCVEGTQECEEGTLTVDVIPPKPVAQDDTAETPPETPVVVDVVANDEHPNNLPLEVTDISNQPANGECVVADGKVQYSPNPDFIGTDSCDYVVCVEGTQECEEGTLTIDVVPPKPVTVDDLTQTEPNTPVVVDVLENDSHPGGLPLEVTDIPRQPNDGECFLVDGKVQYSPNPDFIGTDSCDYTVCVEGTAECSDGTLVIDVLPPRPVAVDDTNETKPDTPVLTDVLDNDSHPLGLPLEVTDIVLQPENGTCQIIGGQVQFIPNTGFLGTDSCDYEVCVVETQVCDTAALVVDVVQPPPEANDDKERTPVNTPVVTYVFGNDLNPSDKPLVIVEVTQPENGGSCDFSSDGYIQYTPGQDFLGTESCDYTVCIEGTTACDTATLVVDVVEVKIAEDDDAETPENTPLTVDVLENDSYPDDPDLPLQITEVTQPENGSCEIIDNQIQYTPNNSFSGNDQCDYTVCTEGEEAVCDQGTLTIDVIPKPVANDDDAETPINSPTLVDVLSNDEPQGSIEIVDVTQPENGVCEVIGNQIFYTPNEDFGQVDSCIYTICVEGKPTSCDDGKVTITILTEAPSHAPTKMAVIMTQSPTQKPTVQPTPKPSTPRPSLGNTRPFALDDSATTPTNTPVAIDVLINDFDFDGDELTVISTTEPSNGWVEINSDGSISYYPDSDFSGNDSFKYTITDGNGGTAEATVVINVVAPTQPNPDTAPPTSQPTNLPTNRPSLKPTMMPLLPAMTCEDMCFEPLDPDECPSCDPSILPSCSSTDSTMLDVGELCESDGECGLDDQLNNCDGTFDVYRRVSCPPKDICRPREGELVTIPASGDAYISADEISRGFNNEAILISEYPKMDGLIKWNLTEEICECITIKKATLQLYVVDPSKGGGFVHVMNPSWDESSITWSNSPESSGPPLARIDQARNETWVDVDVTGLISNSDEHVAVRIQSCLPNRVQYASKEYQQGQFAPQLVIEFGPPPVGMHLLASHSEMRPHYGRNLGRSSSDSSSSEDKSKSKSRYSSKSKKSSKSSKPSKSSTKASKSSSSKNSDSASTDIHDSDGSSDGDDDLGIPEILVCPDPNLHIDFSTAVSANAKGDSTIFHEEQDKSFGSDVLLELSPPQCGNMHAMLNFDVKSLLNGPMIEYASILIHVIEGSDLVGATFLHAQSDWEENTVTWRNAPEYDKVIGSLSTIKKGMWYEVDVTSAVQNLSTDYLSVRVIPSAVTDKSCDDLRLIFASKELDGFSPQLVIVPKNDDSSPGTAVNTPQQEEPIQSSQKVNLVFSGSSYGIFSEEAQEEYDDCSTGSAPSTGKLVIIPTDDAYVSPRKKRLNHGLDPLLIVDGQPGNVSLIRFNLSCLKSRSITSAVLNLYSMDGSIDGGVFHINTDNGESAWDEELVTWNNAPLSYNHFAQLRKVRKGYWYEVDITDALIDNAGIFVTVVIDSTGDNRVAYSSKEGNHAPKLIVEHEENDIIPRTQPIICQKPPSEASLTFYPIEDAVIKEAYSNRNFAYMANLNSKYGVGSRVDSLLKFMFDCVYVEPVKRAVLSLYCLNGAPQGGKIEGVSGTWTEDEVTWTSAPKSTNDLSDDIGRVRKGHWAEIDVTNTITSMEGYELTLRIEGAHENLAVYSAKDDATHSPKLEIFF